MFLFPFEYVARDSKIVIYGAGLMGQTYLHQVMTTQYCEVVSMIDREPERYGVLPIKVCGADSVPFLSFDYLVIAIANARVAEDVCQTLAKAYGIEEEKIIYLKRKIRPVDLMKRVDGDDGAAYSRAGCIPVAVLLCGGFGDYIVRKNNLKELASWSSRIRIDLYVDSPKVEYAGVLFSDIPAVNRVVGSMEQYFVRKRNYLMAFRFEQMLVVDYVNWHKLDREKSNLRETVAMVYRNAMDYYDEGILPFAIHFARCEKDQLNCWTAYNRYGAFHVAERQTTIPLTEQGERDFRTLQLGKYITLNYGAADTGLGKGHIQAKIWPLEYYGKLCRMIKGSRIGNKVQMVQIGMEETPKIENADIYVFGKSIELIKYVLKNSMFHVDCEGGMVHLATQLGTKCAVLFGPTPMHYFGYPSNINIRSETCSDCCWFLMNATHQCYRGLDKPECMWSITPERVFRQIMKAWENVQNVHCQCS